jgi:hypothetical protein
MKKYLKAVLLTSTISLYFGQSGMSSTSEDNKDDDNGTSHNFASLTTQPKNEKKLILENEENGVNLNIPQGKYMYFENEKDRNEKLRPKDLTKLTLDEVIQLINNSVFVYDNNGKYLNILENINKDNIDNTTDPSNYCISSVCSDLGDYYSRKGENALAKKAFHLGKQYGGE